MKNNADYQALKAKALRALARRDHSRQELVQKLSKDCDDHALIDRVLDACAQQNWLNELRFTIMYLQSRAQKYYGPRKIRYELQMRGVSTELIEQAFSSSELDWHELAERARQKKFGRVIPESWVELGKQKQYLYQRGFEMF